MANTEPEASWLEGIRPMSRRGLYAKSLEAGIAAAGVGVAAAVAVRIAEVEGDRRFLFRDLLRAAAGQDAVPGKEEKVDGAEWENAPRVTKWKFTLEGIWLNKEGKEVPMTFEVHLTPADDNTIDFEVLVAGKSLKGNFKEYQFAIHQNKYTEEGMGYMAQKTIEALGISKRFKGGFEALKVKEGEHETIASDATARVKLVFIGPTSGKPYEIYWIYPGKKPGKILYQIGGITVAVDGDFEKILTDPEAAKWAAVGAVKQTSIGVRTSLERLYQSRFVENPGCLQITIIRAKTTIDKTSTTTDTPVDSIKKP